MYQDRNIAVVIPAHNEEKLIGRTIETMPDYIDKLIVVNDASKDGTQQVVESLKEQMEDRLISITHQRNIGVGGSIKTGYRKSMELNMDITLVMAGDGQMDPDQIPSLLDPIVEGEADYTKGNRLSHPEVLKMPRIRRIGNSILTLLTKIASGYWGIIDPQNGYTAISKKALVEMNLENVYDGYGCPNDILIELNIQEIKVKNVQMPPIYGEEKSGIKIGRYSFLVGWLLLKGFFRRINSKYGGLHFHPLWLFYFSGIGLLSFGTIHSAILVYYRLFHGTISTSTIMIPILFLIIGYLSILFAFLFDMMESKELLVK